MGLRKNSKISLATLMNHGSETSDRECCLPIILQVHHSLKKVGGIRFFFLFSLVTIKQIWIETTVVLNH